MALKREVSLGVGLATAALVWGVYNASLPTIADVRVGQPQDDHINKARRMATWTSIATVTGVALLAKDATVAILGGAMVVTLDWANRHANAVDPMLGMIRPPAARGGGALVQGDAGLPAAA